MPKYSLDVREIQKVLNGFLCLFKPPDVGLESIKNRLIKTICQQCNEMYQGEVPKKTMPIVEPFVYNLSLVWLFYSTSSCKICENFRKPNIPVVVEIIVLTTSFPMHESKFAFVDINIRGPFIQSINSYFFNYGILFLRGQFLRPLLFLLKLYLIVLSSFIF